MINVAAVSVLFHPDLARLSAQLLSLDGQVSVIYLVDNSDANSNISIDSLPSMLTPVEIINAGSNIGIAAAINLGLRRCSSSAVDYCLILDQDSILQQGMVQTLAKSIERCKTQEMQVCAVGPTIVDHGHAISKHSNFNCSFFSARPDDVYQDGGTVEVDFLISSGTLLVVSALDSIGFMEEALFIDSVDFEWCFRARSKGFRLFTVSNAILEHQRGELYSPFRVFPKFMIRWHSPNRQYYIMRNRLTLYRRPYVPLCWKLRDIPRMLFKVLFYSIFVAPRASNFDAIKSGFWDAVSGKLGGR